jgi:N-methylhydantoinase A
MYDAVTREWLDTGIVERGELEPGNGVDGPAVIIEAQTTTVVGSHHRCVVQADGSLLVTRSGHAIGRLL